MLCCFILAYQRWNQDFITTSTIFNLTRKSFFKSSTLRDFLCLTPSYPIKPSSDISLSHFLCRVWLVTVYHFLQKRFSEFGNSAFSIFFLFVPLHQLIKSSPLRPHLLHCCRCGYLAVLPRLVGFFPFCRILCLWPTELHTFALCCCNSHLLPLVDVFSFLLGCIT